jgi:hypothetical protein
MAGQKLSTRSNKAARKSLGTILRPDVNYSQLAKDGFLMVTRSADTALFSDAAKAEVAAYHKGTRKQEKR